MRRLLLHIGTEKTGTSSIQRFLLRNRPFLAAQGFHTPLCLADGAGNHSWLPLLAYDDERVDDLTRRWLPAGSDRRAVIAAQTRALGREIEAQPEGTWILSSEHLQSRLTSEREIVRLRQVLEPLFASITLVLYLRQPIATAVSLWSTAVQCGHPWMELPLPSTPYCHNLCDHRATIQRWQAGFPGSPLRVRLFQRTELEGGDSVHDFCATAGIRPQRHGRPERRRNTTLSHRGILLCATLNTLLPRPDDGRPSRLVSLIARATAALPPYRPSAAEQAAYRLAFAESSEWVRREFFPQRQQLWPAEDTRDRRGAVRLSGLERGAVAGLAWLGRRMGLA